MIVLLVGAAAWFVLVVPVAVVIGRAIRDNPPQEPDAPGPVWGCDGCQDEADELVHLEALWAQS